MSETDFERLKPEGIVVGEIVFHGKSMGLGMVEGDINEVIEEHSEELTTKALKDVQTQQHMEVSKEIGDAQEPNIKIVSITKFRPLCPLVFFTDLPICVTS